MFLRSYLRRFLVSLMLIVLASVSARSALAAGPALYPSASGARPALYPSATSGTGFPDTVATVYETAFAALQSQGIIRGYTDGLARPNAPINRVEALKVILRATGKYENRIAHFAQKTPPIPLFSDVDQKQWYAPYIETGFEAGAITGYPDGSFHPAQLLRSEEAITMLMRAFGVSGSSGKAQLSEYVQNTPDQWYTPYINAVIDRNLVMHHGTVRLGTAMTRGQFFDMVYRLKKTTADGTIVFNGTEPIVAAPPPRPVLQQTVAVPVQRVVVVNSTFTTTPGGATGVTSSVTTQPRQQIVSTVAPKSINPYASEKYFAITMPTLGITDLTITHPQDAATNEGVLSILKLGVGHLFSYPGGGGKAMIYGHSSGYPWDVSEFTKIFRKINGLKVGDKVYVTYAGNLHVYQVSFTETIPAKDANIAFQDQGNGEELILFTCWPPDSITQRYLVHAVPVETVALR